ncbi:MAG TPA: lysylphosphatidylglycerol synthase transmembrane domain-containing protein [Candidatus Saccharimonadales bacterium]|nr:lysylphosphatidylglycerol synthase transmembrane domain-containing protein [Candidatus Saccharimonadales bacterium]
MAYKKSAFNPQPFSLSRLVLLVVALAGLYIVLPRVSFFKNSINTLLDGYMPYIVLAALSWLASFAAAAMVYKFLSPKHLAFHKTLLVQLASGFTNRLLPAGAGVIALNTRYLIKQGNSGLVSGAVVATNNVFGFLGNALLLIFIVTLGTSISTDLLKFSVPYRALIVLASVIAAVLILISLTKSSFVKKAKGATKLMIKATFQSPSRLFFALLSSIAVTSCYALSFTFIELAFNVHLNLAQTLIVLAVGVIAATVTPTPGGLGGAEAGLVAALISVGVPSQQALAVALTYRFITYWLPILPGFICLQVALRRRYI